MLSYHASILTISRRVIALGSSPKVRVISWNIRCKLQLNTEKTVTYLFKESKVFSFPNLDCFVKSCLLSIQCHQANWFTGVNDGFTLIVFVAERETTSFVDGAAYLHKRRSLFGLWGNQKIWSCRFLITSWDQRWKCRSNVQNTIDKRAVCCLQSCCFGHFSTCTLHFIERNELASRDFEMQLSFDNFLWLIKTSKSRWQFRKINDEILEIFSHLHIIKRQDSRASIHNSSLSYLWRIGYVFPKMTKAKKWKEETNKVCFKRNEVASNFNWSTWMFDIMTEDHSRHWTIERICLKQIKQSPISSHYYCPQMKL